MFIQRNRALFPFCFAIGICFYSLSQQMGRLPSRNHQQRRSVEDYHALPQIGKTSKALLRQLHKKELSLITVPDLKVDDRTVASKDLAESAPIGTRRRPAEEEDNESPSVDENGKSIEDEEDSRDSDENDADSKEMEQVRDAPEADEADNSTFDFDVSDEMEKGDASDSDEAYASSLDMDEVSEDNAGTGRGHIPHSNDKSSLDADEDDGNETDVDGDAITGENMELDEDKDETDSDNDETDGGNDETDGDSDETLHNASHDDEDGKIPHQTTAKVTQPQPISVSSINRKANGTTIEQDQPEEKKNSKMKPTQQSQSQPSTRRPRVFLGIWIRKSKDMLKVETRRERMIRHTYLEIDYRYKSNDTVCMYQNMKIDAQKPGFNPNNCRLVYAYLRAEKIQFRKYQTFLPVKGKKEKKDHYHVATSWMKWATEQQENETSILGDIDYVAFATSEALILPTLFWQDNAFFNVSHNSTFASIQMASDDCRKDGSSANSTSPCWDHHFMCLSKDLAKLAGNASGMDPSLLSDNETAVDKLYRNLQAQQPSESLQVVPIQGVARMPRAIDGARAWANYTSTSFVFRDADEEARVKTSGVKIPTFQGTQPRMLVGIFSTIGEQEQLRRSAIRDTYLQYYANSTDTPHRICTLQQLLTLEVKEEDCQLAYIFVVSANPNGPFATYSKDIRDYSVSNVAEALANLPYENTSNTNISQVEPDVLYLDIKENMNDGKSDTWFRYASIVTESHYFDYIGLFDSDTLVHTPDFISFLARLPLFPFNSQVYAGRYIIWENRGTTAYGAVYMAGHMYWMSPDVARFVGFDKSVNRTKLLSDMEDMTTGSYVNQYPKLLRHIELDDGLADHGGKLKRPTHFRKEWAKYLSERLLTT